MNSDTPSHRQPAVASIVVIVANSIFLGVALFFCAGFAWAIKRSDLYPDGAMSGYYVAFAVGVGFCLLALRLKPSNKAKVGLATLSVVMTLYFAEAGLTLAESSSRDPRLVAAEAAGVDFDTRSKSEVLDEMAKQGRKASSLFPPLIVAATNGLETDRAERLYPLGNVSGESVVSCNETGQFSVYESDEHGFNNPVGIFAENHLDVALIGDSFTVGSCVGPGEDIGSQMRTSDQLVINLGNASNGPLLELATLLEYGRPLRPKTVFWLFFEGNDPSDLLLERDSAILLRYLEDDFSQGLAGRQAEIDQLLTNYIQEKTGKVWSKGIWYTPISIAKLSALRRQLGLQLPALKLPPLFREIMRAAASQTAAWGGNFHFVYLPDWTRYAGTVSGNLVHRERVLAIVRDLEIPVIDLHQTFKAHPDPLSLFPFRARGHYSRDGYALVAKVLNESLQDEARR